MMSRAEHNASGRIVVFSHDEGIQQLTESAVGSVFDLALSVTCRDPDECLEQVAMAQPDICVIETRLDATSMQFLRILRARSPRTDLLVIAEEDTDDALFRSLRCGASVYLPRATLSDSMMSLAMVNLRTHGAFLPRELSKRLLVAFRNDGPAPDSPCRLTPREREILDHLSRGARPKLVAQALHLSYETVRTHVKNIYKKLGVSSISQAVSKVRLRRREETVRGKNRPGH
jgi:DNA-binding NarL/FixJ family response regulator